MEILSTGEKIKRARVYKGVTLKELCGDKISISKMSCIENGKIKADQDALKFIADKLQVSYDYLVQDVYDQIKINLSDIKVSKIADDKLEEFINYNLEYAIDNDFYDLALELTHILFNVYIERNKIENIQLLISKYYDLHQQTKKIEDIILYYKDMAMFFMKTGEYHEAISYFSRIRDVYENNNVEDRTQYIYSSFLEGRCYKYINEIEKSYDVLKSILEHVDLFRNDKDRGDFYHEFASLNILLYKVESERYLRTALEYKESSPSELADFKGKNGEIYFKVDEVDKAMREIKEAIEIYPREDKKGCGEFLVKCINTLYSNKQYEDAFKYTDEALDLAIAIDDYKLIEKAYYFKGMIYQNNGEYRQAEMYMDLATDFLLRFASKDEKYKRYNEIADLYYKLGEVKESLKYFTLAVNLEKRL